jgi:ribonuclease G
VSRAPPAPGKGQIKTSRKICYEVLRREAKQFNPRKFRIVAA